jgi:hypothetical protein
MQLNRLVQAILRHRFAGQATEPDMAVAATRLLRAAVLPNPWHNPSTWPQWQRLLPHVLTATDASRALEHAGDDVAWLLTEAAHYLQRRGEPAVSLPLFQRAFERRRETLGDQHPDTLTSGRRLALNLRALGQYELARQLSEDTLIRSRRVLGDEHPDTLTSASNLAANLRGLGQYEAARQLDQDVLTRRRKVLGDDHPDTLMSAGTSRPTYEGQGTTKRHDNLIRTPCPGSGECWVTTTPTPSDRPATSPPTCEGWASTRRHGDSMKTSDSTAQDARSNTPPDADLGQPPRRRPPGTRPAQDSQSSTRQRHQTSPPGFWQLIVAA